MKKKSQSLVRRQCDKLLQEIGRNVYSKCLVCGRPMSCLHHYYPKSQSASLRYYWPNLIPLCQGCHFKHHNGHPDIQLAIIKSKGKKVSEWLLDLEDKKQELVKTNIGYYLGKISEFKKILKI